MTKLSSGHQKYLVLKMDSFLETGEMDWDLKRFPLSQCQYPATRNDELVHSGVLDLADSLNL